LPPLRDVIRQHDLRAEKNLGQNFLLDLNLTRKIVRSAGSLAGVTVIEIGPGPGGLTRALLESNARRVIAVEFDLRAIAALQDLVSAAKGRLTVVQGDALVLDAVALAAATPSPPIGREGKGEGQFSLDSPSPASIVANLPYNIATPLLIGWLRQIHEFCSLTLMFQREVAERIVAAPGSDSYGRLAVMTGWLAEAKLLFDIPPQAFTPPPKVTSSVVHIVPRPKAQAVPFAVMEKVVATAFNQRRKMLRSTLKPLEVDVAALLAACNIDPERRAETLSIAEFVSLAQAYEIAERNALQTIDPR
jgi:16S rRNA (adenine1518-N6/adenine1519-N6)-dimethyltransferase